MNQEAKKKKKVLTGRYDLAGNSIIRVLRHQLLANCMPMGNYRGGAGIKCILVLGVIHYLGRPIFSLLVRFEKQAAYLYTLRERMRNN